ncbi:hypothetical protein [Burkholderia ubonensis]|uniref:hypothetical protein n=1 Tax=Burkholderia ubonensis TaxID=101571 RepID=UPI000A520C11|nr:hypothetical protein [Burkholderia ubonensis]
MTTPFSLGHYITYFGLQKYANAGTPDTAMLCPKTGKRREGLIRIEGVPEYPQLSAGLEIGAIYSWEYAHFFDVIDSKETYFSFLVKLGEMVGHDKNMATPDKPAPFFELLRYGLQRAHFGPEVANKLLSDFREWDQRARGYADAEFYKSYRNAAGFISDATEGALYFNGATESFPYEFRPAQKGSLPNPWDDDQDI